MLYNCNLRKIVYLLQPFDASLNHRTYQTRRLRNLPMLSYLVLGGHKDTLTLFVRRGCIPQVWSCEPGTGDRELLALSPFKSRGQLIDTCTACAPPPPEWRVPAKGKHEGMTRNCYVSCRTGCMRFLLLLSGECITILVKRERTPKTRHFGQEAFWCRFVSVHFLLMFR